MKRRNPAGSARMILMGSLHNLTTALCHLLCGCLQIVYPDIRQQSRLTCGLSSGHPRAADRTASVVKTRTIALSLPDIPPKHILVERCRQTYVVGWNLDIAKSRSRQQNHSRRNGFALGFPIFPVPHPQSTGKTSTDA